MTSSIRKGYADRAAEQARYCACGRRDGDAWLSVAGERDTIARKLVAPCVAERPRAYFARSLWLPFASPPPTSLRVAAPTHTTQLQGEASPWVS